MYDDLVYRPGEDSYRTRDLVFRPGVDTTVVETLPYIPEEQTNQLAQMFLDMYLSKGPEVTALPEPMSQEEFYHEVTKRMDRNKPSVQDALRSKFGVSSFREGINRGIFPGAPQVPGI